MTYDLNVERHTRVQADKAAWLKGAATPPALFLILDHIARATIFDFMDVDVDGHYTPKPGYEVTPEAQHALKMMEITTKLLEERDDGSRIVEQKVKFALHDARQAIKDIVEHFGYEALEFAKQSPIEEGASTKTRGIYIGMQPNERRFTLQDKQKDFHPETDEDMANRLLDGE